MIPPQANGAFVYHMEDVLEVYTRPYDSRYPVVCFNETSKQLVLETQVPLPPAPGQVERYDYEYERNGVQNLFMMCEPLAGWRHVAVTERRTKQDYAQQMKELVDVQNDYFPRHPIHTQPRHLIHIKIGDRFTP